MKDSSRQRRVAGPAKVAVAVVGGAALLAVPAFAATSVATSNDEAQPVGVQNAVKVAGQVGAPANSAGSTVAPTPDASGQAPGGPNELGLGAALSGPEAVAAAPVPPAAAPGAKSADAQADKPVPSAKSVVSQKQLIALVKKHFPADQIGNAMAVATCESGQRSIVGSTNSNGTTDWGIFQLNDGGTLQGSLRRVGVSFSSTRDAQQKALDPATNVKAAGAIYADRGWAPWVCAYKQQIVASLYSNVKGPMYGRYTVVGTANGSIGPSKADLAKAKEDEKAKQKAKDKAKEKAKEKDKAKHDESKKPTPTPSPSNSVTPTPTPTPTQSEAADG